MPPAIRIVAAVDAGDVVPLGGCRLLYFSVETWLGRDTKISKGRIPQNSQERYHLFWMDWRLPSASPRRHSVATVTGDVTMPLEGCLL